MSYFQRFRGIVTGIFLLVFALLLFAYPQEGKYIIAGVISISLLVYGFKQLWFYFSMARHMVGGKMTLLTAVIILDLAFFTVSMTTTDDYIILIYLLGIYLFSGLIDILRALEAKKLSAPSWKFKFTNGVIMICFAAVLIIFGLFRGKMELLVYGYCVSLVYSAITRIIISLRRTAIVYIQ